MTTLARYFHTIRYLRPVQILGRVRFLLVKPRVDLRVAPGTRERRQTYVPPAGSLPTLVGPDVFRFLNVERRCSSAEEWRPLGASQLWTYNLHYFDDLNALDAAARAAWHESLLRRWAAVNPPGEGPGWEPYPVSRRIVNWVKWVCAGNALPAVCHASLAVQARWLTQRLEYHILGNHLFANAKALMHAGLYFSGDEAEGWYSLGAAIIERELREQVLADGGHFELSTMYHAGAIEDLLDLINLQRAYGRPVPGEWLAAVERMRSWLRVMTHPDGEISFFNDAAFAVAPRATELDRYAERLCLPEARPAFGSVALLKASGYVRAAAGAAYLICDCAPVGPDYLPGHAHADTLSFELSIGLQRVFVNSGTSEYGSGTERLRQRGTAAHNTVAVDGHDSSEVWGGFRVARRARVHLHNVSEREGKIVIEASHDGYRRLRGRNEHMRRWSLSERSLHIEDNLSGEFRTAEAYFHLAPDIQPEVLGSDRVVLSWAPRVTARMTFSGADSVQVTPATWHPEFGMSVGSRCVVARFSGATLTTAVCWEGGR